MKLRTLVSAISVVILWVTFPALSTQAAMVTTKGQVQYIRTHDATQFPNWAAPKFWFTLKGVSVAGRCQTWQGAVLFVGEDKQELAVVLAAQVSGQEIEVSYDDTILQDSTWCVVGLVTLGNPAPLN